MGEGFTARTVWASAKGLAPGTTYHYRVVATNELGTVVGPDQTFTTETAAQANCPNEQFRVGFSAGLPDCRAYELVTPPTNDSTQPDHAYPESLEGVYEEEPVGLVASDGNRVSYHSLDVMPGSDSGGEAYLATRGNGGWSSADVVPRQPYTGDRCGTVAGTEAFSADLSKTVVWVGGRQGGYVGEHGGNATSCQAEAFEVVPGEPLEVENLLMYENIGEAYRLIDVPQAKVIPADAHFKGASSDLSHVVFTEGFAQLATNALPGVENLYEWDEGAISLLSVLPNGAPVVGSLAGGGGAHPHDVSTDGSHIFFTAGGKLYVRLFGSSTVQVDASQAGGGGGGGQFAEASADGELVYFFDDAAAGLTSDTKPGSGTNLYRFDVATDQLTDLTPGGAGEEPKLETVSEDGSYVYFVARAALAGGAAAGEPHLYLWHDGIATLIATLSNDQVCRGGCGAITSPDGRYLAFTTSATPLGYDNTDASTGHPDNEIYLYDATTNRTACVSCNPGGQAPDAGGAELESRLKDNHVLSDGGRLFFETDEALLPLDTNGKIDVYEYDGAQLHLISTGTSSTESGLIGASESGGDVFFLTRQQVLPQDTEEEARVIYDARVDGGFPEPVSPPPCTTADACRTPVSPQPSIYGAPSSQTFSGAGNLTPPPPTVAKKVTKKTVKCKQGFTKKKNKCVKNKKSKRASRNRRDK